MTGPHDHKHVTAAFDCKALDESGQFEGYASVFGTQDYDGDVIVQGAFTNTLSRYREKGKMPKMLWQHDVREIVGCWDEMHEDDRGLYVKGRLLMDVQKGREAYSMLKAGCLDGMSIGFNIREAVPSERRSQGRVIEEVDLWEVSLVTWGANPDALVTNVKAKRSIRDFERFLRDAGFSRKEAVAIAANGYKGLGAQGEPDESEASDDELVSSLVRLRKSITMEADHG